MRHRRLAVWTRPVGAQRAGRVGMPHRPLAVRAPEAVNGTRRLRLDARVRAATDGMRLRRPAVMPRVAHDGIQHRRLGALMV